jgi:Family of unknown function (DUF5990)
MPATSTLQITLEVIDPVPGCAYALQQGKAALGAVQIGAGDSLLFSAELQVRAGRDGSPDLAGPWVQGPRGGRFIYLNSGTLGGQAVSVWTRRAKISLMPLIESLAQGTLVAPAQLHGRLNGRSRDGGPVCASTPLLEPGWRVVAAE